MATGGRPVSMSEERDEELDSTSSSAGFAEVSSGNVSREDMEVRGYGLGTVNSSDSNVSPDSIPSFSFHPLGQAVYSLSLTAESNTLIQSILQTNKALENQIFAIRERMKNLTRHHESEKQTLIKKKDAEIEKKESQLEETKDMLYERERNIESLEKEGRNKDLQLHARGEELNQLRLMLKESERYTEELRSKIEELELGTASATSESPRLYSELQVMKERVESLDRELLFAKQMMIQHNQQERELFQSFEDRMEKMASTFQRGMEVQASKISEVIQHVIVSEMQKHSAEIPTLKEDMEDVKELVSQLSPDIATRSQRPWKIFPRAERQRKVAGGGRTPEPGPSRLFPAVLTAQMWGAGEVRGHSVQQNRSSETSDQKNKGDKK